MAKKYFTPDFDVTSYDIKDIITATVGDTMEGDDVFGNPSNTGTDYDD